MDQIGIYRHRVSLSTPTSVPDGLGGYTEQDTPLDPPTVDASIQAAAAADLERVTGSAVVATATHLIRMRFHPGVTIDTRIGFNGRTFDVKAINNVDERSIALILVCSEVVARTPAPASASAGPPADQNWLG